VVKHFEVFDWDTPSNQISLRVKRHTGTVTRIGDGKLMPDLIWWDDEVSPQHMVLPDGFAEPDKDQWRDREFCGIAFWKKNAEGQLVVTPLFLYHIIGLKGTNSSLVKLKSYGEDPPRLLQVNLDKPASWSKNKATKAIANVVHVRDFGKNQWVSMHNDGKYEACKFITEREWHSKEKEKKNKPSQQSKTKKKK